MNDDLRQELNKTKSVSLQVNARPGAPKTVVKGQLDDGTWKIDVASVAEDGKANAELIKFLAGEFGVNVSNVEVVSGKTGRKKVVRVVQ